LSEAVLDSSVVVKWYKPEGESHVEVAEALRAAFAAGELAVFAPSLLFLELLNAAGRRWRWEAPALASLSATLEALEFAIAEPDIARVATWVGRGLTAYDAAYVAVAEAQGVPLVTGDSGILEVAPGIAVALGSEDILGALQSRS
jgi:predicted nucleic acid-binding protein